MNPVAALGAEAFVSAEELAAPPSIAEGIDAATELKLRVFGCELIQGMCVLLKLPQVAALSGQVLFHRFYYKVSFQRYDVENTAMAALFLAAKREECSPFRKLKDFINVWDHMRKRREGKTGKELAPMSPWSDEFKEIKERMISAERMILKKLGFVLFVEHPHKFIVMYLQQLQLWPLKQLAWNYCNDSCRTPLCCRYGAELIACGALMLACQANQVALPTEPCVWRFLGTSEAEVCTVAQEIALLYKAGKAEPVEGVYIRRPSRRELKEKAAKEAAALKEKEDAEAAAQAAKEGKARKDEPGQEDTDRQGGSDKNKRHRDDGSSSPEGRNDPDRRSRDRRARSRSRHRSRSRSRSRGRRGSRRSRSRGRRDGRWDHDRRR